MGGSSEEVPTLRRMHRVRCINGNVGLGDGPGEGPRLRAGNGFVLLNKPQDLIDGIRSHAAAAPQPHDERGVAHGLDPKPGRTHLVLGQEGVDFSEEFFSCAHGRIILGDALGRKGNRKFSTQGKYFTYDSMGCDFN
jgi:hypothetical protein